MNIKLTKPWEKEKYSSCSVAFGKYFFLKCEGLPPSLYGENKWIGSAYIYQHKKYGKMRNSEKKAQQDAERLIGELLLDIRDGAIELLKEYDISLIED